ncbi:hypothetical protein A2533_04120 [Candidatus Falkowbacteria bacterium RIFOXYD2_FULL_35_9]|uniref:Hydrolase TatD n=1 Tax=Candidatus Falkowbacteria bacterium RIFOXYC2_FULL_36_12 TaxID=1798002 RepID=A0A1F5SY49_9BACT|nr:MAG: hypothetical protein A2478_04115 [Candidatus Falkowbacteria bacterium RIFOXYC2_FULL_36_12]OGF46712.1 MAG: hypothetical protein A2533_04120 [Candidatus Falkowbacteria bacterium RIFOXYD2_FULL_35_9]
MLIDTHAHVNFNDFKSDFQQVMARAEKHQVAIINVGSQFSTSKRAVDMTADFKKTYASIGLHPVHLEDFIVEEDDVKFHAKAEEFDHSAFNILAQEKKVIAIGECGLDYYHVDVTRDIYSIKEKQKKALHSQIDLANQNKLPLILHCRGSKDNPKDAYKDILSELKKNLPKKRGVIHCFGSDWEIAKQFLELGFYLGFTGVITFDKTGTTKNIISQMPLDRILAETDCPYLTPEPYRGKRNEPIYVEYVVQKIAEIRQINFDAAADLTVKNAKQLFNLVF